MLHNRHHITTPLLTTALLLMSFLLSGCASTQEAERKAAAMLRQNQVLQGENSQLAAELAERNAVTARLQMELVEKQAEIDRIQASRKEPAPEVLQNKVRMSTPSTKVEAVTYLAEVATDINTARELATDSELDVFAQADRLLLESKVQLERGNYDKVCSLASQATELIRLMRIKTNLNRQVKVKSTYADFISPLQLQLAKRSNIRKQPGMHGKIIEILAQKTTVTATGYQGNWINIISPKGKNGWIYYSLLATPAIPELPPPFLRSVK